jgi:hypothetical protein
MAMKDLWLEYMAIRSRLSWVWWEERVDSVLVMQLYLLIPSLRSLWVIMWNSLMNLEWIENMKHGVSQVREWVWSKESYTSSLISCLRSLCYIVWFIINLNNIIPFWDHYASLCEIHWICSESKPLSWVSGNVLHSERFITN